jgi:murein DD-endopeptidase MepM/ murein hydrolase activator NlpD
MSAPATRMINRVLVVAILAAIVWFVLAIPTRSPPGEQATPPAVPAPVAPGAQAVTPAAAPSRAQVFPPNVTLLVPVAGVARTSLVDTFDDARGNGRTHQAIDIMAPRGTPVLAAAEGRVEKLHFSNGGGGITIYVRSPDQRWMYYYAHLDRYAPGLAEGQQVRPGTPIGFVGSTGDASPDGPHLHFAVNAMAPGERWWRGTPVNPYPLLAGSAARR